jgi:hypothetical protein
MYCDKDEVKRKDMMELKYKKTILFFIIIILFFASIYFYKLERSWVFKLKYYYGFKEISKISTIGSFGDGYIINKFSFNEESFSRLKQDLDMKSMDSDDSFLYKLLDSKLSLDYDTEHVGSEIKKISNGLYIFNNTTPNYSVGDHIRNFEIFVFDLDKKMLIYIIFNS